MIYFKKLLNGSTKYFDEPSEKVTHFVIIIVLSWLFYYFMYISNPCSYKTDKVLLDERTPDFWDFGWFSTFASFGFYLGDIIPKRGPARFGLLIQIISVWYVMIS